jgi:streptogramin lyase
MKLGLTMALVVASLLGAGVNSSRAEEASKVSNPYSPAFGHPYRHGAVPTVETWKKMKAWQAQNAPTSSNTLTYAGGIDGIGVTSGTPKVYLVVYGSQWGTQGTDGNGNMTLSNDPVGAVPYLQMLFKGIGTGGEQWSGVMTQYCDGPLVALGVTSCPPGAAHVGYANGGAFAGIWYDNAVASPVVATKDQLAQEAGDAALYFGNSTPELNRYAQYMILSPTGTYPDGFNTVPTIFCAWHAYVPSATGDIAFTNMPYVYDLGSSCGAGWANGPTAGKLDGFSINAGHEYAEILTDQNPNGGWINGTQENGDECSWITKGPGYSRIQNVPMGNGSYAMQATWSNVNNACEIWQTPQITEFPVPTAGAFAAYIGPSGGYDNIAAGPDGALWFTEPNAYQIGKITTAGSITEFPVPSIAADDYPPYAITAGPNGALWFTTTDFFNGGKIGTITTAGAVTEFPIPVFEPVPQDIVSGSDGALWFTNTLGFPLGCIDRITTAGVVSNQYACSNPYTETLTITAGPDGALWFTYGVLIPPDYQTSNWFIGSISTGGVFGSTTQTASAVGRLAAGPDGALWFGEQGTGKIYRINTSGVITNQYPIPSLNDGSRLVTGLDSALWFTEAGGNQIGRITTTGIVTEYRIPTLNSVPAAIVAGSDGAVWFTEVKGNKIGRITVPFSSDYLYIDDFESPAAPGPE